ncbi:hypothetical protein [Emticicia sp. TH156]|uniref:hypothetical protein n=1 Tax=Emticicia sp. TH156 TaxID=2067454 RepID=UPI000C764B7D|nr:hypothetical protein [Emticicia sp. TH156]PLK42766.1 hypothetical protein C0V77_19750 [Emticicia sp. TH156]
MRFYLFLIVLLIQACRTDTPPKDLTRGFYYWKSSFKLTEADKKTLDACHINKLYMKAFDVDWNFKANAPATKAPVQFVELPPKTITLAPTIFITNQTLKQLAYADIKNLADFMQTQLMKVWSGLYFNEIQIDCDWTISTRQKYFRLLELLKQQNPDKILSATIRLHQIKFAHKTGIPPVDRGMLMFYNMSDWKNPKIKNSIFDLNAASQYTATLSKYPLALDVAFPIFRWAVFYRNNRFMTVVNKLDQATLNRQTFLRKDGNRYYVETDTYAFGMSLRKGDLIRTEEVTYDELLKGSKAISKQISTQKLTFVFYYLDPEITSHYSHEQLCQIFLSFGLPD